MFEESCTEKYLTLILQTRLFMARVNIICKYMQKKGIWNEMLHGLIFKKFKHNFMPS